VLLIFSPVGFLPFATKGVVRPKGFPFYVGKEEGEGKEECVGVCGVVVAVSVGLRKFGAIIHFSACEHGVYLLIEGIPTVPAPYCGTTMVQEQRPLHGFFRSVVLALAVVVSAVSGNVVGYADHNPYADNLRRVSFRDDALTDIAPFESRGKHVEFRRWSASSTLVNMCACEGPPGTFILPSVQCHS
jgi:hypothetical protein